MPTADCIFCKIARGELQASKVYEDQDVVAFLDIRPVSPGHTLVIPKVHHDRLERMPEPDVAKLFAAVRKVTPGILSGVGAEAYNLGLNSGSAAGQIVFHVHVHIMPRQPKDGLKLWQGRAYASDAEREQVAHGIRTKLKL